MAEINNTSAIKNDSSSFVTLVSSDAFEFIIPRQVACISGTIRRMLNTQHQFREALSGRCQLENIDSIILEKVCEYLHYNYRMRDQTSVSDMPIPVELCLELLMAADYLEC
ncbi:BTB/POZ protein [Penicillium taxi]|uniref:BTB/POZ protein n=1 Tax=Penicillium taxi TaxID=168475 RepID=UPI0025453994|nr:BTB/POZ protein [Penicillium taxi]KAJ5894777.1 BTB/POZ protein [Penicillium taxi]